LIVAGSGLGPSTGVVVRGERRCDAVARASTGARTDR
jgi:hypothetical protein